MSQEQQSRHINSVQDLNVRHKLSDSVEANRTWRPGQHDVTVDHVSDLRWKAKERKDNLFITFQSGSSFGAKVLGLCESRNEAVVL